MTYSKEIFLQAESVMSDRQRRALSEADMHRAEIERELPEIIDIERKLSSISVEAAKAVLRGADTKTELERLADMSLRLQSDRRQLLLINGYSEDYLEPKYTCPLCSDSGLVEKDGKSVYCRCFIDVLKDCACEEINKLSPLKLSTFSTFNLDFYPFDSDSDGVSPYSRMSKILNYCKNYAQSFTGEGRSILMRGATGLGKTHLSLAIANEVLNKGYYAVYVSAPSILQRLEKAHFSYDSSEEDGLLKTLLDCDLLIIDDLGTEFMTQFTKATVYNIFNNRALRHKPMIINTNMTVKELERDYHQRFVSRIMSECDKLDFIGKDIRAAKGS
ncbi:MAG: ATP-binding protein [Ruminococcus sp.]